MELSEEARQARSEYKRRYAANMSEEAKTKQREYVKAWKKRNPEKVKQYQVNFWESKVSPLTRAMMQEQKITEGMLSDPDEIGIESVVMELKKRGCSLREIGTQLNISHMKVSRILKGCNSL